MLLQRIATALFLFLLIVGVLFWGAQLAWVLLTLPVLVLALWEWGRLIGRQTGLAMLLAVGAALGYHLARSHSLVPQALLVAVFALGLLAWLAVALPAVLRARPVAGRYALALACLSLFNLWVALYELRLAGPWTLLSAMAIVWLADIGAYAAGRCFGRHRLAPQVSPGKTWEGVAGGAVLVVVVALLVQGSASLPADRVFSSVLAQHAGIAGMMAILVVLVLLSVLGDLYESLLKRQAGRKDSSNLLPGHGGIFDRIDALVPSMPLCLLIWLLMLQ